MLKSEKIVYASIRKHTDKFGWGLEESEIIEFTGFPRHIVSDALKKLGKKKLIRLSVSVVASHVFFNDAKWKPKS
tara:strand:- start:1619 stop:1843 length:225 start_codon:yes stop_codon:yes gene_type:complete